MDYSAAVLSVLAVVYIHVFGAMALLPDGLLRVVLRYLSILVFYGALFIRRLLWLRGQCREVIYRGLGYVAAVIAASLLAFFFYSVGDGMTMSPANFLCIGFTIITAYYVYRLILLPLEQVAVQPFVRAPV